MKLALNDGLHTRLLVIADERMRLGVNRKNSIVVLYKYKLRSIYDYDDRGNTQSVVSRQPMRRSALEWALPPI